MCYNTTYKSPPRVRWARLELADRLHGSAFQKHRVCHSTTSAVIIEGSGNCEHPSPHTPTIYNYHPRQNAGQKEEIIILK